MLQAGFEPDYFAIRDARTLRPVTEDTEEIAILAAARLGSTRLIDNVRLALNPVSDWGMLADGLTGGNSRLRTSRLLTFSTLVGLHNRACHSIILCSPRLTKGRANMSEFPIHPVPANFKDAHINAEQYQAMYQRSIDDPEGFWSEMATNFCPGTNPGTGGQL